jgi:hypothetical protein
MKKKEPELKPCPFCGRTPSVICQSSFGPHGWKSGAVVSHICLCLYSSDFIPEEAAKKDWNRRVALIRPIHKRAMDDIQAAWNRRAK